MVFKLCSPPGSLLKVVKRSLTISSDDEEESVPKKKKQTDSNKLLERTAVSVPAFRTGLRKI